MPINSANKVNVSDLFSIDSSIKFLIPKYQREYTWTKENWDDLINDIEDYGGNHYIGSIICVNKGYINHSNIQTFEVIDGQQRLTTISIIYTAIYKVLKGFVDNNQSEDEDLKHQLYNLKNRIIQANFKDTTKLELSVQNNNKQDYLSLLNDLGIFEYHEKVNHKRIRRIYKAHRYFLNILEERSKEEILQLLNKINQVALVRIIVDSTSDAFMLFETLNNRGIPLSAIDLIKNKMLSQVDHNSEGEETIINTAFEKWQKILNNLEEYTIQERFLRQYYNTFKVYPHIKVEGITKATKSTLIHVYEQLIERNLDFIFNDLIEKSKIYNKFNNFQEESIKKELRDLYNIKAAPSYALLLFLYSKNVDVDLIKEIIKDLVKYFVRRNVTDFPNTRNLDQIFIDLIEMLAQDDKNINKEYISKYLFDRERFATLNYFKEKLNGNIYETNIDATRFILASIEERYTGTIERENDFWKRDKNNKLTWTIEHIFPEGKNIPKQWVDMIANGEENKATELQLEWVHKLGNLTLTGFNQNLSNFDFNKKKNRTDKDGRFIGYKNKLYLNSDLENKDSWTAEDIKKRTEKLIDLTIDIFKIEGE